MQIKVCLRATDTAAFKDAMSDAPAVLHYFAHATSLDEDMRTAIPTATLAVPASGAALCLGRLKALQIADRAVSRRHCQVTFVDRKTIVVEQVRWFFFCAYALCN